MSDGKQGGSVVDPNLVDTSMIIAMAVRNQMEDFHVEHLTDAQMKELNPIIRNAIFSVLTAMRQDDQITLGFLKAMIPEYWEPPQLVDL